MTIIRSACAFVAADLQSIEEQPDNGIVPAITVPVLN